MIEIDENKLKRQNIGLERWFNSGSLGLSHKDKSGCLNYFTGVGKTFTAILIIKRYFKENLNANIFIIVPNAHLEKQWKLELQKHFYKKELKFIKIYTADYLITNDIIANINLLIVDELDAFYSDKRIKLLDKTFIRYIDILALTATYEDFTNNRHLKIQSFIPIVDKITEKEALKNNYISKYIEYNLGLSFTEEEQKAHDDYSEIIRKLLPKFGKGSLDLVYKCVSGGRTKSGEYKKGKDFCVGWAFYNNWRPDLDTSKEPGHTINELWHPDTIFGYALKLSKAIKKRKELIYTSATKLDITVRILEKYLHTKSIVFSQSNTFADTLYGIINQLYPDNAVIYHSSIKTQMYPSEKTGKLMKYGKKRLKDRAINRISKGLSNHLITSSALDKGLDVPDLVLGITTSGTQNPTQYSQRGGRVKRVDIKKKKEGIESVSIIVNLYIKNSKEVDWLRNRQSKSKNIIYWIDDIDEISYKPKTKNITINDI